jgi:hypothetical protein
LDGQKVSELGYDSCDARHFPAAMLTKMWPENLSIHAEMNLAEFHIRDGTGPN